MEIQTQTTEQHRGEAPWAAFVCPTCRGDLAIGEDELTCLRCGICYPISGGIPDFIVQDLAQSGNPILRGVAQIDRLAPIYETRLWYPLVLKLYGGWSSPGLHEIADMFSKILAPVQGRILDVACGPATYGRRIASPSRAVYGIDISMGMLRQGMAYLEREGIPQVYLARAQVEALPFRLATFDGAVCGGSLHLFADTVAALREVGMTMKEGAPLAVMTFWAGDRGVLRYPWIRTHIEEEHGAHVFELPQLERYLAEAGFAGFRPQTHGSLLVFSARRCGT
jgi:ubiquinone/menaquinone biosynthesis C-methylase UbiE/uncharacterized protein YbaR (Trm112 family)